MLKAIIYSIVGILFLIITALFTLTSPLSRWLFAETFSEQGLTLTDSSSITLNPFDGELILSKVAINSKASGNILKLDKLYLQVELASLLSEKYIVKSVVLEGFEVEVEKSKSDSILIGGFDTAQLSNAESAKQPKPENPTQSVPSTTSLIIQNITLSDIKLAYKDNANDVNALLSSIKLQDLIFEQATNKKIDLDFSLDMSSQLSYSGALNDVHVESNLSLSTPIKLSVEPKTASLSVKFPTLSIALNQIKFSSASRDIAVSLDQLATSFNDVTVIKAGSDKQEVNVNATTDISLSELLVNNIQSNKTFLSLGSFNLDKTNVSLTQNDASLDFKIAGERLALSDLQSMLIDGNDPQPLLVMKDFTISDWKLDPNLLSIAEVNIGKVNSNIIVSEDKRIANLYLPDVVAVSDNEDDEIQKSGGSVENVKPDVAEIEPVTSSPKIQITYVHNNDDISIKTTDLSVVPTFNSTLDINKLELRDLDSVNTNYITTLNLQMTNNEYAKILVDAKSQLFTEKPWHEFTIKLDEIDLVSISPYVSSALGYHITNGQLDSDIAGSVRGNIIDGNAELFLRSIDLEALKDTGEKQAFDSGAISFNYALGMLKDSDGNVELEVPFKGDLNNPSVGFSGFLSLIVKRATMSAAKDYLINTFVPYANIVSFAVSAGQEALKLRFKDFEFASKQQELSDEQIKTLNNLADVLTKYPAVSVRLCPISTPSDLDLNKTEQDISLTPEQLQSLRDLALLRAGLVKEYLVVQGEIASKRLLACNPSIDYDKDSKSRIELKHL